MVKRTDYGFSDGVTEEPEEEPKESWDIGGILLVMLLGPAALAIFFIGVRYLIDILYYLFTTPIGGLVH